MRRDSFVSGAPIYSGRDKGRGGGYQVRLMLAAFLTTVLFSMSAVCGRRTARMLGGTEANFWRLCFAALAVYAHGSWRWCKAVAD